MLQVASKHLRNEEQSKLKDYLQENSWEKLKLRHKKEYMLLCIREVNFYDNIGSHTKHWERASVL